MELPSNPRMHTLSQVQPKTYTKIYDTSTRQRPPPKSTHFSASFPVHVLISSGTLAECYLSRYAAFLRHDQLRYTTIADLASDSLLTCALSPPAISQSCLTRSSFAFILVVFAACTPARKALDLSRSRRYCSMAGDNAALSCASPFESTAAVRSWFGFELDGLQNQLYYSFSEAKGCGKTDAIDEGLEGPVQICFESEE